MSKPLPMPRDGGSYRREADGRLTCLEPTTGAQAAAATPDEPVKTEAELTPSADQESTRRKPGARSKE